MKGSLYTVEDLAAWRGCKRAEIERLIAEDGLPVISWPGAKRPKKTISPTMLCGWLNKRSTVRYTVEELIAEIDRAIANRSDTADRADGMEVAA